MKKASVLAALFAGFAVAAPLHAQGYERTKIINSVDADTLEAIVDGLGHTVETKRSEGRISVVAANADGLKYVMNGTACDQGFTACKGILMQVVFRDASEVTDANINKANNARVAVTSWVNRDDDTYGFSRYLILDEGMTMGNVRRSVEVLLAVQKISAKVARGEEIE